MRCPDVAKLMAYVNFELSDQEWWQIHHHLQDCPDCRQELASVTDVLEVLADVGALWATEPEAVLPVPDEEHIPDVLLQAFARGDTNDPTRAEIMPHLARCVRCLRKVAEFHREAEPVAEEPAKPRETWLQKVAGLSEIVLSWTLEIDLLKPPSELKLALTMGRERDAKATEDGVMQCSVTVPSAGRELKPDEEVEGQIAVRLDPNYKELANAIVRYRLYDGEELAYEGTMVIENFRGLERRPLRRARHEAYKVIVEVLPPQEAQCED